MWHNYANLVFTGQSEIASDNLRAARLSLEISEGRHRNRKARFTHAHKSLKNRALRAQPVSNPGKRNFCWVQILISEPLCGRVVWKEATSSEEYVVREARCVRGEERSRDVRRRATADGSGTGDKRSEPERRDVRGRRVQLLYTVSRTVNKRTHAICVHGCCTRYTVRRTAWRRATTATTDRERRISICVSC